MGSSNQVRAGVFQGGKECVTMTAMNEETNIEHLHVPGKISKACSVIYEEEVPFAGSFICCTVTKRRCYSLQKILL